MNKFKNMTHSQEENNITRQDKIDVRIDNFKNSNNKYIRESNKNWI